MTIEVQDLSELDPDAVQQAFESIKQLTQEEHPSLDLRRGVFSDTLLLPSSQHAAANQTEVDRVRRSNTLKGVEADPTLADDDIVDGLMSNYRIERRLGEEATGQITIVVSKLATVSIPNGAAFQASGNEFQTTVPYTARTSSENVQSATDRVLTPLGDGTYSFTIDVTAVTEGTASLLTKDTSVIPQIQITNFVRSYTTSDFLNGRDTETNSELLLRVQQGLSTQALSGRSNMMALLTDNFTDTVSSSIIGFGDAEMVRDQRSIFPVSYGGRVDWYVRTRELPQRLALIKTATLVSKTVDGKGIWQLSLARDDAPGFYDVNTIVPTDVANFTGTYAITNEVRSIDDAAIDGELLPDIQVLAEANFSRYIATVVQFKDSDTSTTSLTEGVSTKDYDVTVRAMPQIDEIQTLMASRDHRNYAGDVLVRGIVPCFVSLAFTLEGQAGAVLPDLFDVKNSLAQYVNRLGFCGRLHASALSDVIHNFLQGKVNVSAIDMNAQILRPDGTMRSLRDFAILIIPDESANMVSARTVAFVLDPDEIAISAKTVNIPQI